MKARAVLLTIGVAALLVVASACSSDDTDAAQTPSTLDPGAVTTTTTIVTPTSTVDVATLPPAGALELDPYYGQQLAALGLRLTDRGGLIDRTGGGYEASAQGRHLALYVEPIEGRTLAEYVEGIRSVTAIFADDIFDRWPGLESFDVCQEPTSAEDDSAEPLPVTQIEMTRAQAAAFDYDTVTVTDLVRASLADPPGLALRVSTRIATDPAYKAMS